MQAQQLQDILAKAFPNSIVKVSTPDEVHYQAQVISAQFSNKSKVQQHRMVYQALDGLLESRIHALQLDTQIPEE